MARLAIDFGTSNSGAAVAGRGLVPLQGGEATMPTALFFDPYSKKVLFGHDAVDALIDGQEGRFLRALKSVLGQPILREKRVLGGEKTTLLDVIARFLSELRRRAEQETGDSFDTALSGRPVRFHSRNDAYNAQAALDLAEAYVRAGFSDVQFLPEPEAAALASGGVYSGYGLVVDIGGGTSDYTVFRGQGDGIETVASYGIRLGGTDFDRLLNIAKVMPQFGLGTMIGSEFGSQVNEAPRALFHDLATWEKIPFQYSAQTIRDTKRLAKLAVDGPLWARLVEVLEMELAHEIAHSVEGGKISANTGAAKGIDLGFVERGLQIALTDADLSAVLNDPAEEIGGAALQAVRVAGLAPNDITRVVMVGGSSLMNVIENAIRTSLPNVQIDHSDAFTAIVDGLAIAASRL